LGSNASAFVVDVADPVSVDTAVNAAVARFGGIHTVIANAGITGPVANVATIDPDDFAQVIHINLLGVFNTVRAALPYICDRDGYILVTASIMSAIPGPTVAAYAASKAGVEAFGRALRIELGHTGIGVGIAYFGVIDTGMIRGARASSGISDLLAVLPGFAAKPAPVRTAGAAVVSGIERRAHRVYAPWYARWMLDLRTPVSLADPMLHRIRSVADAIRVAAAEDRQPLGADAIDDSEVS
jgi:NAD(P)-dependent dehydrogenase (short-subunit alcohol dehydrogenase family)